VRHPFERLVSAYQNKIAGHGNGLDMGSKYRGLLLAEYGDTSFVSFIKWLVSKIDKRKNGQCGEKPIFDIESPCHINSHWAPLQAWCDYCSIPYNIIAKFETFGEDLRYIAQLANVTFVQNVHDNISLGNGTSSKMLHHMIELDSDLLTALYEFYEDDFLMFGYNI